jgi:hypothetical protein
MPEPGGDAEAAITSSTEAEAAGAAEAEVRRAPDTEGDDPSV